MQIVPAVISSALIAIVVLLFVTLLTGVLIIVRGTLRNQRHPAAVTDARHPDNV